MTDHLAPCDRAILARIREEHLAMTREAFAQGRAAWLHELATFARDWGFALERIRVPTALVWGRDDRTTTLAAARAWAKIPGSRLRVFRGAGHFVHYARWREVVREMAGDQGAGTVLDTW